MTFDRVTDKVRFDGEVELEAIRIAAESDLPVLITGPRLSALSLAAAIHRLSHRRLRPILFAEVTSNPDVKADLELLTGSGVLAAVARGGTLILSNAGSMSAGVRAPFHALLNRLDASGGRDGVRVIATTTGTWPDDGGGESAGGLFRGHRHIHIAVPAEV